MRTVNPRSAPSTTEIRPPAIRNARSVPVSLTGGVRWPSCTRLTTPMTARTIGSRQRRRSPSIGRGVNLRPTTSTSTATTISAWTMVNPELISASTPRLAVDGPSAVQVRLEPRPRGAPWDQPAGWARVDPGLTPGERGARRVPDAWRVRRRCRALRQRPSLTWRQRRQLEEPLGIRVSDADARQVRRPAVEHESWLPNRTILCVRPIEGLDLPPA